MSEKNTADIGFEKQIWNAACVLRGNMDASEYKGVVLGLIFLKYISDRFEDKYNQLVADGDGFEEDRDEYTSEGIFFVPAGARWSDVSAKAHDPEIGQVIDDAMRAIEKENVRLKDILPENFARPELDKRRLGEVVDLFTNIKMIEHGSEKDILGRMMQESEVTRELVPLFDVLVDGKFVEDLKNLSLKFRGSENQRILDVPRSLAAGKAVWMEQYR